MSRTLSISTGHLTVQDDAAQCPGDIYTFLTSRNWSKNGDDWQHLEKGRYSMTWEQAVACEFYEFITIGGVR
jgi:hypothetical protein